jgi:hypothetical protein
MLLQGVAARQPVRCRGNAAHSHQLSLCTCTHAAPHRPQRWLCISRVSDFVLVVLVVVVGLLLQRLLNSCRSATLI